MWAVAALSRKHDPTDISSWGTSGRKLADNETLWTEPNFLNQTFWTKLSQTFWIPIAKDGYFPPNKATKAEEINDTADVTHVYVNTEEGELCRIRLMKILIVYDTAILTNCYV